MPPRAVFDLDHPDIGIALHGAGDIGVRLRFGDELVLEGRQPAEIAVEAPLLGKDAAAEVELVQLHHHHAAHRLAAMDHGDRDALDAQAPDMGLEPEVGGETVIGHGGRLRIAWAGTARLALTQLYSSAFPRKEPSPWPF